MDQMTREVKMGLQGSIVYLYTVSMPDALYYVGFGSIRSPTHGPSLQGRTGKD